MTIRILMVSIALCIASASCSAKQTALVGANLVVPKQNTVVENSVVLIEGQRIVAVGTKSSLSLPDNVVRVNLAGKWLMPGYIEEKYLPNGKRLNRWNDERSDRLTKTLGNLQPTYQAGVTVATGTDAGNIGSIHGPAIFREFELMAEAGLTPAQILETATVGGAKFMGRSDLGQIAAGAVADMVVLDANPLLDIHNASQIFRVIKSGKIYDPKVVVPETSEDLVQRQVNAYNAGDVGAFMATYAEDVKVMILPDTLFLDGHEAIRKRYETYFQKNPNLHVEIKERMNHGNFIVDSESVTGYADGSRVTAVAIYQVEDGLIKNVWFASIQRF